MSTPQFALFGDLKPGQEWRLKANDSWTPVTNRSVAFALVPPDHWVEVRERSIKWETVGRGACVSVRKAGQRIPQWSVLIDKVSLGVDRAEALGDWIAQQLNEQDVT